jgi:septum formation protein
MTPSVILASASAGRAALLRAARVDFETIPAAVDEAAVKAGMLAEGAAPRDIADALAELKARRVAGRMPERLVLGADQVLVCEGRLHDKPGDLAAAREQLVALRGRRHELLSAAVVFEAARPVWRHVGRAQLTMRPFSDAFLDAYLVREGDAVLGTVGSYRLEDGGAGLFSRAEGDIFTVMGLPLLELLAFLRTRGIGIE